MKRILHIHQKFFPHLGGSTTRLLGLIQKDEINRHLVLAQYEGFGPRKFQHESISIFTYKYYWQIPFYLWLITKTESLDVYHSHNYRPLFYTWLFTIIKGRNIKWVHELHSMYLPQNRLSSRLGLYLLNKPSKLIVLNYSMKNKLFELVGVESEVIYSVPNIPFAQSTKSNIHDDKLVFGYLGSLDSFQGVMNIVELAKKFKDKNNVEFIIVGGHSSEMAKYVDLKNLPQNLNYEEAIDISLVGNYYKSFDYLLMLRDSSLIADYVIPLKPLEAAYYGLKTIMFELPVCDEIKTLCGNDMILVRSRDWLKSNLDTLPKYLKAPNLEITEKVKQMSTILYDHLYDHFG